MQLKAQLLSSHLPYKFAQTAQIQVASLAGRLLYNIRHATPNLFVLRVEASLVRIFEPEDEHCDTATAQLSLADHQDTASY